MAWSMLSKYYFYTNCGGVVIVGSSGDVSEAILICSFPMSFDENLFFIFFNYSRCFSNL